MNQYGLKNNGSSGLIDQLTYGYQESSNKLIKVTDTAPIDNLDQLGDFQDGADLAIEYSYDESGNMTGDANKKISFIGYNYLNLPDVIKVSGKGSIYYSYDAAGVKLRKRVVDSTTLPAKITTTLYVGNAVYVNDTLQFFATGEGRARVNTGKDGWIYDYFLKDHLGNTRMVITDDYNVASPILEVSSYYPFGLQQGIGLMASPPNRQNNYKYNGIEFDEDLSINIDEAFYRSHDPQLGRFWQIDPKIEGAEGWSPYSAMLDNPILNTDPLGDSSRPWIRIWGGVKALGGLGEMAVGGALAIGTSWTGAGAVGGAALVAHGADVTATGVLQLWSGKEVSTFTEQAISSGLQKPGVSEGTASTVATIADGAFCIAGIGLGSMAARASKAGDFSLRSISTGSAPTSELGEESISLSAAKGGIANSRALGIAGEQAVGVGSKTRIPSLTGTAKYRIPDQLTSTTLGEVKNVSHLSLTRQLTDFHMFSQQTGRQFILYTRPNTTFLGPLQNLINNGSIITKPIPFK